MLPGTKETLHEKVSPTQRKWNTHKEESGGTSEHLGATRAPSPKPPHTAIGSLWKRRCSTTRATDAVEGTGGQRSPRGEFFLRPLKMHIGKEGRWEVASLRQLNSSLSFYFYGVVRSVVSLFTRCKSLALVMPPTSVGSSAIFGVPNLRKLAWS